MSRYEGQIQSAAGFYDDMIEKKLNSSEKAEALETEIFTCWDEYSDDELCRVLPFLAAYETEYHNKEYYQKIQEILKKLKMHMEKKDPEADNGLTASYMEMLAACCRIIDEELFDHYKNFCDAYRQMLHRVVPVEDRLENECRKRIGVTILAACNQDMILREKYEKTGRRMQEARL